MKIARVTAPATDPVTVAECKLDLRLTIADHDALIADLISAAVDYLEGHDGVIGRAMISQTWRITLPSFPLSVDVPVLPVQSISSIKYFDPAGAEQTLAASSYRLVGDNDGAFLEAISGVSLPSTETRSDAVKIDFVAGYGDAATTVPNSLRHAVRLLVSHWFENGGVVTYGSASELPHGLAAIIAANRVRFVG